uniref:Uncharacterized protein n=1 Tax=viral metagenome TaxID=1070528 RepID=A0A6C0AE23_9ZZZZ
MSTTISEIIGFYCSKDVLDEMEKEDHKLSGYELLVNIQDSDESI